MEEYTEWNDSMSLQRLAPKPILLTTAEMTPNGTELNYTGGVRLGPVLGLQLFWSAFLAVIPAIIVYYCYLGTYHGWLSILSWTVCVPAIFFIARSIKALNPVFIMTRRGISINDGPMIEWTAISGTFILIFNKNNRGLLVTFLVIADSLGQLSKYELFGRKPEDLSAIIEYFKRKQND